MLVLKRNKYFKRSWNIEKISEGGGSRHPGPPQIRPCSYPLIMKRVKRHLMYFNRNNSLYHITRNTGAESGVFVLRVWENVKLALLSSRNVHEKWTVVLVRWMMRRLQADFIISITLLYVLSALPLIVLTEIWKIPVNIIKSYIFFFLYINLINTRFSNNIIMNINPPPVRIEIMSRRCIVRPGIVVHHREVVLKSKFDRAFLSSVPWCDPMFHIRTVCSHWTDGDDTAWILILIGSIRVNRAR
jgi:hypothetical protein